MATKKTSVGLIVLTELPKEDGLVVVLQRRGSYNFKKMKPESWPRGCQVTCHGKMEESDKGHPFAVLWREIGGELGHDFLNTISRRKIIEISDIDTGRERVITFAVFVEIDKINTIRLHASSGGLFLLSPERLDVVIDLTAMSKTNGVPDDFVSMFPDELQALKLAFKKLCNMRLRS